MRTPFGDRHHHEHQDRQHDKHCIFHGLLLPPFHNLQETALDRHHPHLARSTGDGRSTTHSHSSDPSTGFWKRSRPSKGSVGLPSGRSRRSAHRPTAPPNAKAQILAAPTPGTTAPPSPPTPRRPQPDCRWPPMAHHQRHGEQQAHQQCAQPEPDDEEGRHRQLRRSPAQCPARSSATTPPHCVRHPSGHCGLESLTVLREAPGSAGPSVCLK